MINIKAGEVLNVLQISRMTLKRYRDKGYLEYIKLPTGHFDYDADSVYRFKNKQNVRFNFVYGRVSTYKQKNDLKNQIEQLKDFVQAKGLTVDGIYQDIASGISFEKRKSFFEMLDLIIQGRVKRVFIIHKDRLSRVLCWF